MVGGQLWWVSGWFWRRLKIEEVDGTPPAGLCCSRPAAGGASGGRSVVAGGWMCEPLWAPLSAPSGKHYEISILKPAMSQRGAEGDGWVVGALWWVSNK